MNERREPTISGMRADSDDARKRNPQAPPQAGSGRPTPPRPAAPRQVVVQKSGLATFAFLLAFAASGAAGYLYWQGMEAQKVQNRAEQRIAALEEALKMTDSESTETVGAIQESLKTHFSEIDKLWAAYRKHKSGIEDVSKDVATSKTAAASATQKVNSVSADVKLVNDLVDAQRSALNRVEKENANVGAQSRALNEKIAKLERTLSDLNTKVANSEKDIEAINGFRRSVNQQLIELRGTTASQ